MGSVTGIHVHVQVAASCEYQQLLQPCRTSDREEHSNRRSGYPPSEPECKARVGRAAGPESAKKRKEHSRYSDDDRADIGKYAAEDNREKVWEQSGGPMYQWKAAPCKRLEGLLEGTRKRSESCPV